MQISSYKAHTTNSNAKYRENSRVPILKRCFYRDNLWFICENSFLRRIPLLLREQKPSGTATIANYFGSRGAARTGESPRRYPLLLLFDIVPFASYRMLSFCFLCKGSRVLLRVARSFASATYQPWLLWCRHYVTKSKACRDISKMAQLVCIACAPQVILAGLVLLPERDRHVGKKFMLPSRTLHKHTSWTFSFLVPWIYSVNTRKKHTFREHHWGKKHASSMGVFMGPHVSDCNHREIVFIGT